MKKIYKKLLVTIAFLLFVIVFNTKVNAASASLSASSTNPKQGDTVTVTGNVTAGAWNLKLSGNSKSETIYGYTNTNTNSSASKSITFTAGTPGTTYSFSLSGDMTDISSDNSQPVSKSLTIKVSSSSNSNSNSGTTSTGTTSGNSETTSTKSNNANLSNLGITPNDFTGFSPSKTTYSVTVPNDIESVEVYANGQSGQTITGRGKISLKEGNNTANVKVTAEDGKTTKTYTINITRKSSTDKTDEQQKPDEETPSEENPNEATEETTFGLAKLNVEGLKINPEFKTDVYEYNVKLVGDKDKLDIETEASEKDSKIEITGNENLKEGENVVTIIVTDSTGEKTLTYQIIVNKTSADEVASSDTNNDKNKKIIMTAGGTLIAIVIVGAIIIIIKMKKLENDDYGYDYEVPYSNLNNNEDKNKEEIDTTLQIDEEQNSDVFEQISNDDVYEEDEKPREKKKHSKGKRFK